MYQLYANKAFRGLVAVTLFLFLGTDLIFAADLTIKEAGQLALKDDYTLQAISARSRSMSELSVAVEQLPDPMLKLGFANLPTDTFNLGQEAMTQAVIGVRQMFPRGHSLLSFPCLPIFLKATITSNMQIIYISARPVILEEHLLDTPVIALEQARREILRMTERAKKAFLKSFDDYCTESSVEFRLQFADDISDWTHTKIMKTLN